MPMPSPAPAEQHHLEQTASALAALAVCGPFDPPPAPPAPPHQPRLRGLPELILLGQQVDWRPARRKRAPRLWHIPRRLRLEQLLVLSSCLLPLIAYGPAPLRRRRPLPKLPVITRSGVVPENARRSLEGASDSDLLPAEIDELFARNVRPRSREECRGHVGPCPWVSCRHHLFLDVHPTSGSIRLNHPGVALEDMADTCSLDVAERVERDCEGTASLSTVARHIGVSHERVRQIEAEAQERFAAAQAQDRRWAQLRQIVRKSSST